MRGQPGKGRTRNCIRPAEWAHGRCVLSGGHGIRELNATDGPTGPPRMNAEAASQLRTAIATRANMTTDGWSLMLQAAYPAASPPAPCTWEMGGTDERRDAWGARVFLDIDAELPHFGGERTWMMTSNEVDKVGFRADWKEQAQTMRRGIFSINKGLYITSSWAC